MPDYSILKTKLADPAIAALADEQARADALNTKDIAVKTTIYTYDIKAYLFASNKWRAIKDGATTEDKEAIDALTLFDSFDAANPTYLARLTQVLDGLITTNRLLPNDKTAILAFGDALQSWSDQNWTGDVTLTDIANARSYL